MENQETPSVVTSQWEPVDARRLFLGEGARFLGAGFSGAGFSGAELSGTLADDAAAAGAGVTAVVSEEAEHHFILVDIMDGHLYSTTAEPGSGLTERARVSEPLGAVAPLMSPVLGADPETGGEAVPSWVAAVGEGVVLLGDRGGEGLQVVARLGEPAAGRSGVPLRMNDAVADPHGRFWAGAMAYDGDDGQGFLLRLDPDGSIHIVLEELAIPNGPAFTADGETMYLSETTTGWISRFSVDAATGALGPGEKFVHVSEGGPDGMTVDAEGCLWSAVWGGSCLHRYSPQGELLERIPVPVQQPTSIALSAVPPYRVMVTSATQHLESPTRHDGRVITAEVSVAGRPAVSYIRKHE